MKMVKGKKQVISVNEKPCEVCKKKIDLDKQKYVLLGTYDKKKPLSEPYFHFFCFDDWYNQKVNEKAENKLQGAMKRALGMLGQVTKKMI